MDTPPIDAPVRTNICPFTLCRTCTRILENCSKIKRRFEYRDGYKAVIECPAHKELVEQAVTKGPYTQDSANEVNMNKDEIIQKLYYQLREQLNDCINFDGGKLTDRIMLRSSRLLNELQDNKKPVDHDRGQI